jgi:hypothetical protein
VTSPLAVAALGLLTQLLGSRGFMVTLLFPVPLLNGAAVKVNDASQRDGCYCMQRVRTSLFP